MPHTAVTDVTLTTIIRLDARRIGEQWEPPYFVVDYCLFHKNKKPHKAHRFDPEADLVEGDVVLLMVEKEGSTDERGWEIAEVVDMLDSSGIGVVFLQPSGNFRGNPFGGDWYGRPLARLLRPDGSVWYDEYNRSNVTWASQLTAAGKIPEKEKKTIQGQIYRMTNLQLEKTMTISQAAEMYRREGLPMYPVYDVSEEDDPV